MNQVTISEEMNKKLIIEWGFLFQWVLASALGAGVGWGGGLSLIGTFTVTISTAAILLGATIGALIGILQLFILRQYLINQAIWWVLASLLGWAIGFPLGSFIGLIVGGFGITGFAMNGAIVGAMTGVLQIFIFQLSIYRGSWWVLINALGWAIGFAVGWSMSQFVPGIIVAVLGEAIDEALSLTVAGAVAGMVTGIPLIRLLERLAITGTGAKRTWMTATYLILFCLVIVIFFTNRQEQVNDLTFNEFNEATQIQIQYPSTSPDKTIRIDDPEKIKFAREFIKEYPNEWKRPELTPIPAPLFFVEFFNKEEKVGAYGVGPDFLVYETYWRPLTVEDRMLLIEILDIPAVE